MIKKELIIELVERNPSVGKHTNKNDVKNIRLIYAEIFNDNNKEYEVKSRRRYPLGTTCHTCIIEMLNSIRDYVGFPPITKKVTPKLSEQRVNVCISCKYSKGEGALLTCGTPIIGETVPEGKLCGCFVRAKAQFDKLYCPLGFWDSL